MSEQIITVQARMLSIGDIWQDSDVVTLVGQSHRPGLLDVTFRNRDTNRTRVEQWPRIRWVQIKRQG